LFGPKSFSTKEWLILIAATVVALAFLPGTSGLTGVNRIINTVYGLVPLALIIAAVYAFYRWWQTDQAGIQARPKACPNCGTETAESWKVCPQCGHNLQRESVFCRYCAQPMLASWKVCPVCARPADATAPAPPPSTIV
jgi:hypothetical protein